ncbi:MAG TPA: hypothetical protein VKA02_03210 [Candidatus Acidoferrum sp.]|nr:hypothetical protein [Candidatus Acidoferrum sp.]
MDNDAPSHDTVSPTLAQSAANSRGLFRYWLAAILLLGVFAFCVPTIPSADMWWHLSTGRYILQNHSVPHTDPFSTTIAGQPWIIHEWLSEVVFYFAYSTIGSVGLLLLTAFVLTLAFWFAYGRSGGPLLARILSLALGVWAASPIFSVRPQIFSYLLASAFLFVLSRYFQNGSYRLLVLLPLLTILWVNFHGGYVLGLTLILLFAAGAVADWLAGQADGVTTKRRVLALLLACASCLLVAPLNPNGFALLTYPIAILKAWGAQTDIMEWRSPDFHLSIFRPFAVLMLLTVAVLALSPKRPRPSQILLFIFFSYVALYSMRNLPFFVLVAFPLLAEYAFLPAWKFPAWRLGLLKAFQAAAVLLVAVVCAKIASDHIATELDMEQSRFPARAASFLDAQKLPAPLFNSYDFGGYLIWRLYPRYRVYIDGRTDVYGLTFFNDFIQVYQVNADPRPTLDHAGIRTVLVEPQSNLAGFLRTQTVWKRVYEDPVAVIFSR